MAAEATTFASSNLSAGEYDPDTQELTIEFASGDVYTYSNVPQSTWAGLKAAGSPGSFFHRQIRDRFRYSRG